MRRLAYRRSAERDLLQVYNYVWRESGSEDIADGFCGRIAERCDKIASLPGTVGTRRDELRPGLRSVSEGRYLIFFRYAPGTLTIIRIVHAARNHRTMFPRP